MTLPRPLVAVYSDPEALSLAAATFLAEEAREAVRRHGRFTIALAGGSTPRRTYELLASPPTAGLVPWESIHVFWSDERCVDPADPRSNERLGRDALLAHVPIPPDQVHPMRCGNRQVAAEQPGDTRSAAMARQAAHEYDALLRSHLAGMALDLVLLGLGSDGHTASLFPGSTALTDRERFAAAVFVAAVPGDGTAATGAAAGSAGARTDWGMWRITLTAPFINKAAAVVFLASGPSKAAAVREVMEGPADRSRLPAQLIRPAGGRLHWYLDADAAALLAAPARDAWALSEATARSALPSLESLESEEGAG